MPSTGFTWIILKSCSHAAGSESGLISQTHTRGSCVNSGGWRGRSLPRHSHRNPVCTVEAGVAGHFLDTRKGILVNSRGWHGRSLPRHTHRDPACTAQAGVAGHFLDTHRDPACTAKAGVAGHFLDTRMGILRVQRRLAWQVTS